MIQSQFHVLDLVPSDAPNPIILRVMLGTNQVGDDHIVERDTGPPSDPISSVGERLEDLLGELLSVYPSLRFSMEAHALLVRHDVNLGEWTDEKELKRLRDRV
jgi:hypothetical protein